MKFLAHSILLVLFFTIATTASAQENENTTAQPSSAQNAGETIPNVDMAQKDNSASGTESVKDGTTGYNNTVCLLGLHTGVPASDAETAAELICKRLSENGAPVLGVQKTAEGASSAYRIDLRRLGESILVDVSYEAPVGSPHESRSLQLRDIEEIVVAAPRLARALVHDEKLEDTAEIDTLVGEETRVYEKIYGEYFFGLGILGAAIPTHDIYTGFGGMLKGFYETPSYAVGVDVRLGGSNQSEESAVFFGMSVGARYFFNNANISPFVGGGLGFMIITIESYESYYDDYEWNDFNGMGMSSYAEVGVEFLRFHGTRLDLALRIDVPFFTIESDEDYYYDYRTQQSFETEPESSYAFPISLNLVYAW